MCCCLIELGCREVLGLASIGRGLGHNDLDQLNELKAYTTKRLEHKWEKAGALDVAKRFILTCLVVCRPSDDLGVGWRPLLGVVGSWGVDVLAAGVVVAGTDEGTEAGQARRGAGVGDGDIGVVDLPAGEPDAEVGPFVVLVVVVVVDFGLVDDLGRVEPSGNQIEDGVVALGDLVGLEARAMKPVGVHAVVARGSSFPHGVLGGGEYLLPAACA